MRRKNYLVVAVIFVVVAAVAIIAFLTGPNRFLIPAPSKPRYNIILVISDQQAYHLQGAEGYRLPAHEELQQRGVTFTNHYAASAMCSASRAALLTGTPPQVNGVFDQMGYPFTPTLDPARPNMGSVLKALGYFTAYFGKFEMDKAVLKGKTNQNTSTSISAYGFDVFNPDGDTSGAPRQGYYNDPYYIGEAVRWLHHYASNATTSSQPFFMVVSLLNPHDIMFADANIAGQPQAQQPVLPLISSAPADALYAKQWQFKLPQTLTESLSANGMPTALLEYQKGWATSLGYIPTNRPDMWTKYYNYYLNAIRDNDRKLQTLTETLTDMDLWKNTIVIFTADHGDMGGTHGGLRGKGPMAYENNAHIPLIIDHPNGAKGVQCHAITSHLDMLPTLVGLTGMHSSATKQLSGHDFSGLLHEPEKAAVNAVRPGVLFNYVGISTVDSTFLIRLMSASLSHKVPFPQLSEINTGKRGFLSFVFDGRYKFARFYAPKAFNTPKTLEDIFKNNDVQLFDLQTDPAEANNLALDREKNKALILRMNGLLNDLMAQEVGVNDGKFLPAGLMH